MELLDIDFGSTEAADLPAILNLAEVTRWHKFRYGRSGETPATVELAAMDKNQTKCLWLLRYVILLLFLVLHK